MDASTLTFEEFKSKDIDGGFGVAERAWFARDAEVARLQARIRTLEAERDTAEAARGGK
jgi:hypothetical protein